MTAKPRKATIKRETRETRVELTLDLDGTGKVQCETGVGFLDHMLDHLGKHSLTDLTVSAAGDLEVDDHHTTEDVILRSGATLYPVPCTVVQDSAKNLVLSMQNENSAKCHLCQVCEGDTSSGFRSGWY